MIVTQPRRAAAESALAPFSNSYFIILVNFWDLKVYRPCWWANCRLVCYKPRPAWFIWITCWPDSSAEASKSLFPHQYQWSENRLTKTSSSPATPVINLDSLALPEPWYQSIVALWHQLLFAPFYLPRPPNSGEDCSLLEFYPVHLHCDSFLVIPFSFHFMYRTSIKNVYCYGAFLFLGADTTIII